MRVAQKTIKFSIINIIIILGLYCFSIYPARAENNSFASGTLVLTNKGNISIEKLDSGDRVIGYNFESHQEEVHHIKDIQQRPSLSYYLINDRVKLTGTHYVYVKTANNPVIKRVQQLKVTDRLFGQNHQDYVIDKIEQIVKPLNFYQIILEDKNSNFFTNQFLVYSGSRIPINFQENYTYKNCESGTLVYEMSDSRFCPNINAQTIPGITISLLLVTMGLLIIFKFIDWIQKINFL